MPATDITYWTNQGRRTVRVTSWELLPCGALQLFYRRDPYSRSIEESPARTEIIAPGHWERLTFTDIVYHDAYEAARLAVEEERAAKGEI